MFIINGDKSIYATRGDIVHFMVSATFDGKPYTFKESDIVRFEVYEKKACNCVELIKDFAVDEDTQEVEIYLEEQDTKFGGIISKPVDYWYEVVLNPDTNPQTIIGYDNDGAKIFKVFPEGKELTEDDDVIYDEAKLNVKDAIEKAVEDEFAETPIQGMVEDYLRRNPADSRAYIATYGETTIAELQKATNEHKAITLRFHEGGGAIREIPLYRYYIQKNGHPAYEFKTATHDTHYNYYCTGNAGWGYRTFDNPIEHTHSEYVKKSGDTMTGALNMALAQNGYTKLLKNHNETYDGGTDLTDYANGSENATLNVSAKHNKLRWFGTDRVEREVLHTGNKKALGVAENIDKVFTIAPDVWSQNTTSGIWNKSIFFSDFLATDRPIVDVMLGSDPDANDLYLKEYAKITRVVAADSYLRLYCNREKPEVTLNFTVKVVR